MIKQLYLRFLILYSTFIVTSHTTALPCNRTCGSTTAPYPFGFSSSCTIPLECKNSAVRIGEFSLLNFTPDTLLFFVPPACNRSVSSTSKLFGPNFALTRNNGFLLQNCSSGSIAQCSISGETLSQHLNCASGNLQNISCFTDTTNTNTTTTTSSAGVGFLTEQELVDKQCKFLLSSATIDTVNQTTELVFREVEVGWWVKGTCNCSQNANCTRVNGSDGYRCKCRDGFEGDGFVGGNGCRKVTCGSIDYITRKCGKSSKIGRLVGVIVAGACLVVGIIFIVCLVRCCHRRSTPKQYKRTRRLLSEASFNVPFYPFKTIERATENFSDTHRLGTGAFGTVYVGHLSNGELIAVKKIKHPEPETIEKVINEVKMISSVNHPHLVRLLGCCIDKGEQILVYEFMSNGTLSQHLQRQRGPGLPWTIRLAIATETAKAIAYLHCAIDPPIFHRDIKSSNILLDHQFNAKIADFGLSRTVVMSEFSHISTVPQGTPGYVDPQYHQNYHLSDKSDVYSFGVVLMEIITGLKVVDFNRVQSEVNLAAMAVDRIAKGKVDEIIDPFLKGQKDSWTLASIHKVAELAFRCLAFHRDMRPSMTEVADELEHIRLSCWIPKDGDVIVVPPSMELCSSPLIESKGKSKRLLGLVSERIDEENVNSPVSVQDSWASEKSNQSSGSFLGSSNRFGSRKE